MNPSIKKLAEIASKQTKTVIGLMSGTSLDGLDIALCEISGSGTDTEVTLIKFTTKQYPADIKKRLKTISSIPEAPMEDVCLMHTWLGDYQGKLVLQALDEWDIPASDIDCIASHGQTIYHAPKIQHGRQDMPNATLQIGDGDHLAQKTGILTISDFRQKHTAAGGEGAPMVSLVDRMLYRDDSEDRVLLNIGGIANFTYLPARSSGRPSVTTDTGPGNTLIDAAVQEYFEQEFDTDGKIAQRGSVNEDALAAFKSDPYFQKALPKTTGPEVFNLDWVNIRLAEAGIKSLSPENLVTTLTRLTAETIADSITNAVENNLNLSLYISGGGIHNPALVGWIQELLPNTEIKHFNDIGFDPDAKEAVLFAVLANEMLSGEGFRMDPESDGNKTNFGKLSFPS